MTSHWSNPLKCQSSLQPEVIVTSECSAARHDLQYIPASSRRFPNRSRDWNYNLLENHGIDICTEAFPLNNCDIRDRGTSDAKVPEYTSDRAGPPVGSGGMHTDDILGYRSERQDEIEGAKMRESCLARFDRFGSEIGAAEEAETHIEDPRQEVIAFDIIFDESYLMAEAKRLREKHQGASSIAAMWVGAQLLRLAIAEAQSAV